MLSPIFRHARSLRLHRAAAALGVALAVQFAAGPAQADGTAIRFADLGVSTDDLYRYLALADGIYRKHGIDLQPVNFLRGGPEVIAAAASQQLDMGELGTPILAGISRGIGIRVVGSPPLKRQEFVLVSRPEIGSVEDLKGRTLGVGSVGGGQSQALRFILNAHSIAPGDVKTIAFGASANGYFALKSGQLAAAIMSEPETSKSVMEGFGKLLAKAVDYYGRYQHTYVFASQNFIAQHPDAIRAYFAANREAIDYATAHRAELVALGKAKLNLDETLLERIFDEQKPDWDASQSVDEEGLLNAVKIVQDLGDIDKSYVPQIDRIVDPQFIGE